MPARRSDPPFTLGDAITRDAHAVPYDPFDERLQTESAFGVREGPVTRRLAVYTQDPATPRMDVATADALVPFEPLDPGPEGRVIRVIDTNHTTRETYDPLDLDRLGATAPSGIDPSTMDPRFAQQMTYAVTMVTYDRFRQALGRTPDFSFPATRAQEPADDSGSLKLHVYPHGMEEDNAYYDPDRGALLFGYTFANKRVAGMNQPGGLVFISLSHDILVHEMTHALLDGMRAKFLLPTNPDVDAFHEAFSDLVALFQRFQYRELVIRGVEQSKGELDSRLLTDLARQWGQTTGDGRNALRTALVAAGGPDDPVPAKFKYDRRMEAHDLGAVLVAAVFDAFRWICSRKTASVRRLAAREPAPSRELVELLAASACRVAGQFLNILIRAIDYCPPVDLTFGEFLRAIITADFDLVPEDPWGYRDALVQAFRRYGIVVDGVPDLSEDALLWRPPDIDDPLIEELAFGRLKHVRRPGEVATTDELRQRATALGKFVTQPALLHHFGLARPARKPHLIEPPVVESIRTMRRIGQDNTVHFDLVAEVIQRRLTGRGKWFYGGSTVIIDAYGRVRYAIGKHVTSTRREREFGAYMRRAPALYPGFFGKQPPSGAKLLQHLHKGRSR
jgi:hypothetical protein